MITTHGRPGIVIYDDTLQLRLSPQEFRVLAHLIQCGGCECPHARIGTSCKIRTTTVKSIITKLAKWCLVTCSPAANERTKVEAVRGIGERVNQE